MKKLLAAVLIACQPGFAGLAENIQKLIDGNPASRTAFWGIQVVDLASGKTLYELNPDHYFEPASNTKLFSTALALNRLGADFRFQTRVVAETAPEANGRISGALYLIGGGDPNLSARAVPYQKGPITGNPLAAIEDLAAQIAARGVKRVEGGITGDDTWYLWEPYASGWGIDDPQSDDGPPISALTLTDNAQTLHIAPGHAAGDLAALTLNPPIEFYRIDNRVRTIAVGGERRIRFKRIPGSRDAQLWGTIPLRDRGQDMAISIEDPAEYAARALQIALETRGVEVVGGVRARHQYPDDAPRPEPQGVELARRSSASLLDDLRITDKVSQNLHAELALRAAGKARRNEGGFAAGLDEMKAFLTEIGIDANAWHFMDGSGLSRQGLLTPNTVVKLLRYMYDSPARADWISLLPIAAQDGSLSTRFGDTPAAGRVHAKTGSLAHVSALSGYIERPDGTWLAFSILVNNFNGRTAEVRGVMDRICNLILE
ncbi:MAG TPA: D-alanyl-D-alanine carboxypeptidase/D-alanyl-D-alanine-endopeptidase [Candidatus Solibacter sp.]|nr:D-alanyl-D-alanine carboxypeptidase/D-alanyl-D-alanine-endopeptidase [Candidatus Solibacter sp.]